MENVEEPPTPNRDYCDPVEPGGELDMVVLTAHATSDGELKWGPRFDMTPVAWSHEGKVEWEVTELNLLHQRVNGATVEVLVSSHEPLICIAARAAQELWAYLGSWPQNPPRIEHVLIEVRYGEDVAAKVKAERHDDAWVCEAWAFQERCRLQQVVIASTGDLVTEQLVAWLLCRLVFVGEWPQPWSLAEPALRLPLPWRTAHDQPTQRDLDRESLLHSWGA